MSMLLHDRMHDLLAGGTSFGADCRLQELCRADSFDRCSDIDGLGIRETSFTSSHAAAPGSTGAAAPDAAPCDAAPAAASAGCSDRCPACDGMDGDCYCGLRADGEDATAGSDTGDESDRFSDVGEPGATEVVFVKEGVAVWPARDQRIVGRLSLVKQFDVLFLSWLPYADAGACRCGRGGCGGGCAGTDAPVTASGADAGSDRATRAAAAAGHASAAHGGAAVAATSGAPVPPCLVCSGGGDGGGGGGAAAAVGASAAEGNASSPPQACRRRRHPSPPSPPAPPPPPAVDRTRYAVHPLPLSDVQALTRHTPPLGWHYLVVVLVSGVTLPPLFFHQGGVRELIRCLKQHVHLARAAHDPNTYLVNDPSDPLQRSLTSLELADIMLGAPPPGAWSVAPPPGATPHVGAAASAAAAAAPPPPPPRGWAALAASGGCDGAGAPPPPPPPLLAGGWAEHLGGALSRVTAFARDSASSLVTAMEAWGGDEEGHLPGGCVGGGGDGDTAAPSRRLAASAPALPAGGDAPPTGDRDERCAADAAAEAAAAGAPPPPPHRVSASLPCSPVSGRGGGEAVGTLVGSFELLEGVEEDRATCARARARPPPLTRDEFATYFNDEGVMVDGAGFRERVFYSGVEMELRGEAWPWLLGVWPAGSSAAQRAQLGAERRRRYAALKAQWESIGDDQARRFTKWRERRSRVEKDVRRTDRSHPFYSGRDACGHLRSLRDILLCYSMYNFDVGYVQGMSDLLSPLLYVLRSEADAFWGFAALMDRLEANFHSDQRGMHAQLLALRHLVQLLDPQLHAFLEARDCLNYFFCFRWLLIHFKREFAFDEVLRLWEAQWSCHVSPHLHLYLAAAVLIHHRRAILGDPSLDFDGLLKFFLQLSGRIELDAMLRLAEALALYAGDAGREALAGLLD